MPNVSVQSGAASITAKVAVATPSQCVPNPSGNEADVICSEFELETPACGVCPCHFTERTFEGDNDLPCGMAMLRKKIRLM